VHINVAYIIKHFYSGSAAVIKCFHQFLIGLLVALILHVAPVAADYPCKFYGPTGDTISGICSEPIAGPWEYRSLNSWVADEAAAIKARNGLSLDGYWYHEFFSTSDWYGPQYSPGSYSSLDQPRYFYLTEVWGLKEITQKGTLLRDINEVVKAGLVLTARSTLARRRGLTCPLGFTLTGGASGGTSYTPLAPSNSYRPVPYRDPVINSNPGDIFGHACTRLNDAYTITLSGISERDPLFWRGKLMLFYQLVRRLHETYPPSFFYRRV
jgi:hypothetical protein